ncbi:MAG: hypothetical protein RSB96_01590 [Oscillospiraceae bacterium]
MTTQKRLANGKSFIFTLLQNDKNAKSDFQNNKKQKQETNDNPSLEEDFVVKPIQKTKALSATGIIELTKKRAHQNNKRDTSSQKPINEVQQQLSTRRSLEINNQKSNENKQEYSSGKSLDYLKKLDGKKSTYAQRYEEIYRKRNQQEQEVSYINKFKTDYININFGQTSQIKLEKKEVYAHRYYSEDEFEQESFYLEETKVTHSQDQFSESREKKIDDFFSSEILLEENSTQKPIADKRMQFQKEEIESTNFDFSLDEKQGKSNEAEEQPENNDDGYMNIKEETLSLKIKLMIRLVSLIFLFGTSLYLALSLVFIQFPLPSFLIPEKNMQMFLIVNTGLFIFAALICCNTIGAGFIALFKGANNDTPIAIATVACIIQSVLLIFAPQNATLPSVNLLYPVVLLGLIFNTYGKLMLVSRINQNMDLLIELDRKTIFCLNTLRDAEIIKHMTNKFSSHKGTISLCKETQKITDYVDSAFSQDYSEVLYQKIAWVSLLCSVAVAGGCYYFTQNPYIAITAFATLMVLCAPFTAATISNFPIKKANKKLNIYKTLISGYDAVDEYGDTQVIMINIRDIFTPASIIMHGMKVFDQNMIDCAILDSASIMHECQNHLEGVFLKLVDGDKTLLNDVSSIVYEDGLGISAWVNGKRVLIGNRELMALHEIKMPNLSYQEKFTKDGKDVLYVSNSGSLIAMFLLSYQKVNGIAKQLEDLAKQKVSLLLYSTDPNINAEKISKIYKYPDGLVHMISGRYASEFINSTNATPFIQGGIIMNENTNVFKAIASAVKLKHSIITATIVQYLLVLIGFSIVGYLSFVSLLNYADFWQIILYQLLSFGIVTLFTLKKYD